MLGNLMSALMQPASGGQQSAGANALTEVVSGLMGGQQGGNAPAGQLLGALEQVIGGNPTSGQLAPNQGQMPSTDSPLMGLLGPVANMVAQKTGIPPAVATTVAATAMHYLVSSHPAAGGNVSPSVANVVQQAAAGNVSTEALHSSGMVNAVAQATGLSQQQAAQSLNATFNAFQAHAAEHQAKLEHKKKRED